MKKISTKREHTFFCTRYEKLSLKITYRRKNRHGQSTIVSAPASVMWEKKWKKFPRGNRHQDVLLEIPKCLINCITMPLHHPVYLKVHENFFCYILALFNINNGTDFFSAYKKILNLGGFFHTKFM
jgi:hypothetical protein